MRLTARQSSAREGSVGFKTARHAFSDRKAASSQQGTVRQKTQTRQHFADLGGSNGWTWSRQPD